MSDSTGAPGFFAHIGKVDSSQRTLFFLLALLVTLGPGVCLGGVKQAGTLQVPAVSVQKQTPAIKQSSPAVRGAVRAVPPAGSQPALATRPPVRAGVVPQGGWDLGNSSTWPGITGFSPSCVLPGAVLTVRGRRFGPANLGRAGLELSVTSMPAKRAPQRRVPVGGISSWSDTAVAFTFPTVAGMNPGVPVSVEFRFQGRSLASKTIEICAESEKRDVPKISATPARRSAEVLPRTDLGNKGIATRQGVPALRGDGAAAPPDTTAMRSNQTPGPMGSGGGGAMTSRPARVLTGGPAGIPREPVQVLGKGADPGLAAHRTGLSLSTPGDQIRQAGARIAAAGSERIAYNPRQGWHVPDGASTGQRIREGRNDLALESLPLVFWCDTGFSPVSAGVSLATGGAFLVDGSYEHAQSDLEIREVIRTSLGSRSGGDGSFLDTLRNTHCRDGQTTTSSGVVPFKISLICQRWYPTDPVPMQEKIRTENFRVEYPIESIVCDTRTTAEWVLQREDSLGAQAGSAGMPREPVFALGKGVDPGIVDTAGRRQHAVAAVRDEVGFVTPPQRALAQVRLQEGRLMRVSNGVTLVGPILTLEHVDVTLACTDGAALRKARIQTASGETDWREFTGGTAFTRAGFDSVPLARDEALIQTYCINTTDDVKVVRTDLPLRVEVVCAGGQGRERTEMTELAYPFALTCDTLKPGPAEERPAGWWYYCEEGWVIAGLNGDHVWSSVEKDVECEKKR